jgi:hypothetical protein
MVQQKRKSSGDEPLKPSKLKKKNEQIAEQEIVKEGI